MPQQDFSPYFARGRSSWRNTIGGEDLSRTASLPSLQNVTLCGWAVLRTDNNDWSALYHLHNNASAGSFFGTDTTGVQLAFYNDGPGQSGTGPTIVVGRPFFWAATLAGTGAGQAIGYYRELNARAFTTLSHGGTTTVGATRLRLSNDDFTEEFLGNMWNVRVWDRVLSARELMLESLSSMPVEVRNLHAWWPLEGNFNELILDRSGNNRHLTRTGGRVEPFFLPATTLTRLRRRGVGITTAGGTQFNQAVAGSLTGAGVIVRQTNKIISGSSSGVGVTVRQTNKAFSGSTAGVGGLIRSTLKSFSGSTTATGDLTSQVVFTQIVTGALAFAGSVIKLISKPVGGAISSVGQMVKQTTKTFSGSMTMSGILDGSMIFIQSVAGVLSFLGNAVGQFIAGGVSWLGGWWLSGEQLDRDGIIGTVFLDDVTAVPATAVFHNGFAYTPDGRRYVANWPSSGVVNYHNGMAIRPDGAMVVTTAAPEVYRAGFGMTNRGELCVALMDSDHYNAGIGVTTIGRTGVSNL